jgi:hypothetical protein
MPTVGRICSAGGVESRASVNHRVRLSERSREFAAATRGAGRTQWVTFGPRTVSREPETPCVRFPLAESLCPRRETKKRRKAILPASLANRWVGGFRCRLERLRARTLFERFARDVSSESARPRYLVDYRTRSCSKNAGVDRAHDSHSSSLARPPVLNADGFAGAACAGVLGGGFAAGEGVTGPSERSAVRTAIGNLSSESGFV